MHISSLTLRFFIHATEDEGSVLETVSKALEIPTDSFHLERVEGHYGNPLTIVEASLFKGEAEALVRIIIDRMRAYDKSMMAIEIETYLDKHNALYFRLSKQELFAGRFTPHHSDPITIRVKTLGNITREAVIDAYRRLLRE